MNLEQEDKYKGLPPDHAKILKSQTTDPEVKGSPFVLYQFSTKLDIFFILVGLFFAIVQGVALPLFTLVLGSLSNDFSDFMNNELDPSVFGDRARKNALYFVYLGIGMLGACFISNFILISRGEVLAGHYRKRYLEAILKQNVAFFDTRGTGKLTTSITKDTAAVQAAVSEKTGIILSGISSLVAALVIGFAVYWKLTLILLSGVAFIILSMSLSAVFMVKYQSRADSLFGTGSEFANEALSSIRTTMAFSLQDVLLSKYDHFMKKMFKPLDKRDLMLALSIACCWGGIFWIYTLAFWEGARLVVSDGIRIFEIITVVTAILIGAFQVGQIAPFVQFVVKGVAAARSLDVVISRNPVIDCSSDEGLRPSKVKGNLTFKNLEMRYPSRPDVKVLSDFSLNVPANSKVALVGASGSGKSTIVGLLERFYLPLQGEILLDGTPIEELNTLWLRQQIGYVSQEPTLFSETILENVAYGLPDRLTLSDEAKRDKVIDACIKANAWNFIQKLELGLDTNVGDRGLLLSGGQKQRISIARAIVSNPPILLLDEATSALDTKSEAIVQEALENASQNRTTIVIAHRLSTIKDVDNIVVMVQGRIVEQGTHLDLIEANGRYSKLVELQKLNETEEKSRDLENDRALEEKKGIAQVELISESLRSSDTSSPNTPSIFSVVNLLLSMIRPYMILFLIGLLCGILLGVGYTALAMLLGKAIVTVMVPEDQYPKMISDMNRLSGFLFMVGVFMFLFGLIMVSLLGRVTQRLIREARVRLLAKFLSMKMSFFDDECNTPGSLTTTLGQEGQYLENLGGLTLGTLFQSLAIVVAGITTSIAFTWRVGLVATACFPILCFAGFLQMRVLFSLEEKAQELYRRSGIMASEYASSIRTVQSLCLEGGFCTEYDNAVDAQIRVCFPKAVKAGLAYGFSTAMSPFSMALVFWYSSFLLQNGQTSVMGFYIAFISVVFGAQSAGSIFGYSGDLIRARTAANRIYSYLGLESRPSANTGDLAQGQGLVEFKNIYFRYPTRPNIPVLNGLSFKVLPGQTVALVGASGCGKSTTIGLLERFYDPDEGAVFIDGIDIATVGYENLRKVMALVQQEPCLYSGTIRDNVFFGLIGIDEEESDELLFAACKKANIHDFVMSLPDGYDTSCGANGALLSGGQKQRIAIARALIRNPRILLLDEATSALDSEAESAVQTALNEAAKGRTTITIAHRLSTIQNADVIHLLQEGTIVESGSYQELLSLGRHFAEMVKAQTLDS